MSVQALL